MKTDVIEKILANNNYSIEQWEQRGLNPSERSVIDLLDSSTKGFLKDLKSMVSTGELSDLENQVSNLIDELPWDKLDREEKDYLAEILAPAIRSLGLDPWQLF